MLNLYGGLLNHRLNIRFSLVWMSKYIPHNVIDVITDPCPNLGL